MHFWASSPENDLPHLKWHCLRRHAIGAGLHGREKTRKGTPGSLRDFEVIPQCGGVSAGARGPVPPPVPSAGIFLPDLGQTWQPGVGKTHHTGLRYLHVSCQNYSASSSSPFSIMRSGVNWSAVQSTCRSWSAYDQSQPRTMLPLQFR